MAAIARPAAVVRSSASVKERIPLRDGLVPEALPTDPLPSDPSDPDATPAPHRSPGGVRLPLTFRELVASPLRSSPRAPAWRWSSHAERHTPAWPDSASPGSADRWSKRGHTARHEKFLGVRVAGQKRGQIALAGKPVFWASGHSFYPAAHDPFRP